MPPLLYNTFYFIMITMQQVQQILAEINKNPYLAIPLMLWTVIWKGLALWKAARKEDKIWFAALLVLNTLGIAEILYFFVFSKRGKLKV